MNKNDFTVICGTVERYAAGQATRLTRVARADILSPHLVTKTK